MSDPIRVFLVDDHPMLLHGVRLQLDAEPDLVVVGTARTGGAAVEAVLSDPPDIVVLDISLPDIDGLQVARQIRESTATPVVMLTMHDDEEYFVQAVRAGASGFVLKNADAGILVDAVRRVHAGEVCFPSIGSAALLQECLRLAGAEAGSEAGSEPRLTPRERDVIRLVAEGLTSKEIASQLSLSVRTIETYRERIMRKLDLHSVVELTRYAISNGLVVLE